MLESKGIVGEIFVIADAERHVEAQAAERGQDIIGPGLYRCENGAHAERGIGQEIDVQLRGAYIARHPYRDHLLEGIPLLEQNDVFGRLDRDRGGRSSHGPGWARLERGPCEEFLVFALGYRS